MKHLHEQRLPAISLVGLTKEYRDVLAVDRLFLKAYPGEIYGFLGRNGAGKTTTIRMMLGLIRPSAGSAELFQFSVQRQRSAALGQTGSLVEAATSYPNLSTRENLELQQKLKQAPADDVDRVMNLLGLEHLADRRSSQLSLGNRQRLALARALIGSPSILVLDEPTNGLDPAGIVEIRKLLKSLASEQNICIFVSSHILGEMAQLADRIGIINKGKLIEEFPASNWANRTQGFLLDTSDNRKAVEILADLLPAEYVRLADDGRAVHIDDANADPAEIAAEIVHAELGLRALVPQIEDLEAHFLHMTGGAQ